MLAEAMNPYPSYKPSGIDWIGEIPNHWELKKVKHKGKTLAGGTPATGNPDYWDGDIPWLNSGKIQNNFIFPDDVDKYITQLGLNESATKMIRSNSVLVALTGATCANIGYLTFQSTANQSVVAIENDLTLDSKFLYYFLLSQREQILIEKTGGAQSGINEGDVKNLTICFPPKQEQTAIANFLDERTAQIDKLISNKQKLIKLLKEERTVIINEAVGGKGKNWERKKLKYVCSLLKDGTHLPPPRVEFGVPLLSVRNLVNGRHIQFLEDDSKISEEDFILLEKVFRVKVNDILLAIVGATMGKVSIVPAMTKFTIQRSVGIFRTKENKMLSQYLFFYFQSSLFQNILWHNTGFSAQPGIYLGSLSNFTVTCPPLGEQTAIVEHIQTETQRIDNTISKIEKEIELIQEYRTALISEVVTGKMKVV